MKREPKLKDCANELCTNEFKQYKSTVKVCSMGCAIAYAKQKNQKDAIRQAERDKAKHTIERMTTDKYRAVKIQPLMNLLARIIDNGQPCIATGNHEGKMAGGHRHSVGSARNLSLNLHNIHIQSWQSNDKQGGDHVRYRAGLIEIYGRKYANFIDEDLMQCPSKLWTKDDLVELRLRLQKIVNDYKHLNKIYTPLERIKIRNQLNVELGMYPKEFAVFEK